MSPWVRVIGLSLLAVVTAGCAVEVKGSPTAAGTPTHAFDDRDRITAEDALGDLAAWNPCSVVDPDALPRSWKATVDVPVAFEDCKMSVTAKDGTEGEVQVGYLFETEKTDGEERDGGITIVPDDSDAGACARNIVFADDVALVVRTWGEDPKDTALCDISDAVVDTVLADVMAGKAEPLDLPDNSIGEIDPCELVTTDMATQIPGITADVAPDSQLSGHSCWWSADEGHMLNVEFEVGELPSGDSGETVRDRYTAVYRYGDDDGNSLCSVSGEHVPVRLDDHHGLMERVGIYVYEPPGQIEQACAAGKQLADRLWQKLPPL